MKKQLSSWQIVCLYVLFGGLWIYLSDRLLERLSDTFAALSLLQTYKGWFYIALTAFLLFVLLRLHARSSACSDEKLAESVQRYQEIFNAANDAFLIFNPHGIIVEANPKACVMYGYPYDRLIGLSGKDIVHPDHLDLFAAFLGASQADLQRTIESRDVRADGSSFAVEVRGTIIPFEGREHKMAIVRDVSARKHAERQLLAAESKWDQAMDFVDDAICIIDLEDRLVRANRTFYRMMGLVPDESIGRDVCSILHPQGDGDSCSVCTARKEMRDTTAVIDGDYPGNPVGRPLQVIVKMIRDSSGEVVNILMGLRDLSNVEELRRQSQIIDQTYDAVIATDKEGKITLWNQGAGRIFGMPAEDAVGCGIERFFPADALQIAQENLQRNNRAFHELEVQFVGPPRTFFGHISFAPLRNQAGKNIGVIYSVHDITERKKARVALGEQLSLLKLGSDVGIALTAGKDLGETLQHCCEVMVQQMGGAFSRIWTVEEEGQTLVLQASAGMYTHIDGNHGRIAITEATKIGSIAFNRAPVLTNSVVGDPQITDQEWAKREGMVAFAGHPLLIDNKLVGVMALFSRQALSDMALRSFASVADQIALGIERSRSEAALQRRTAEFEIIFRSIPDGVLFTDSDFRIVMANPALCRSFGYQDEELRGQSVALLSATGKLFKVPDGHDAGDVPVLPYEARYRRRDGGEFVGETLGAAVKDAKGKVQGYIGIIRDITMRKEAEAQQEKLQRQIRQAQKMEAMGTLAGGIAHDFNNILSAIMGFTDLAQLKLPQDSEIRSDLVQVIQAGNRAKEMVGQILAFSRQSEQEYKPVEIGMIVKEALKLLRASIPTNIEIRSNIVADAGAVFTDPTQIHQVIMNLCTNAYHAMRETGGLLEVTLESLEFAKGAPLVESMALPPGKYLRLSVADTGCGINPADLERIFEPYYTTKGQGEGTGLGLSVVHGIVKNCGGEITAESEPGTGSLFSVYLPKVESFAASTAAVSTSALPHGDERILVVDDETPITHMLTRMLQALGYTVTALNSSEEAAILFGEDPQCFDLVMTDMAMPRLTGLEMAQRMLNVRPDIPIIMCTGFSEVVNEEKAKNIGIREFLLKPVLFSDLALVVRKVLGDASTKGV